MSFTKNFLSLWSYLLPSVGCVGKLKIVIIIINIWKFANIQHLTVMFWALDPDILKEVVYISVSFFSDGRQLLYLSLVFYIIILILWMHCMVKKG